MYFEVPGREKKQNHLSAIYFHSNPHYLIMCCGTDSENKTMKTERKKELERDIQI